MKYFRLQLELAKEFDLPVMVHTPHRDKKNGTNRSMDVIEEHGISPHMVVIDHNIQELIRERDRLRAYYDLLNLVPGNTGETIYEILWAADRWQTEVQSPLRFEVTNAIQLHESQIIQSVQVLEDFARL